MSISIEIRIATEHIDAHRAFALIDTDVIAMGMRANSWTESAWLVVDDKACEGIVKVVRMWAHYESL